jgi:enterochelin esterase-like enzyme
MPFIGKTYSAGRWGVMGKSSGGYGAMLLGMRHAGDLHAVADHSGDSNFELCYIHEFGEALDRFREAGGPSKWLAAFWADENRHRKKYMRPLDMLAMSAHYSPNPSSPHLGLDLPVDLDTGQLRWDVWERWRAWDPVNLVEKHKDALRSLRLIYIDCGSRDEWNLHWGARALVATMRKHGLTPHYEEFEDGHMSISYRYDVSIPMLVKALQG